MFTRSEIAMPILSRPPHAPCARDIDQWFDAIASSAFGASGACACGVPPMNAWMTEEAVFVEAELPGFSLDKIELTLVGRDLTIRGERDEAEVANGRVLRRERPMGSFVRTLKVPVEIQNEGMKATLKDGVVRITLPRTEATRPRRIEVSPE